MFGANINLSFLARLSSWNSPKVSFVQLLEYPYKSFIASNILIQYILCACNILMEYIFSSIEFPEYPDNIFIATQAPRPNTIKHFWHMVIQAEVVSDNNNIVIVINASMLTILIFILTMGTDD